MIRITLTQSQTNLISQSDESVEVVDADGRFVGFLNGVDAESELPRGMKASTLLQILERIREPVQNLLSTSQAIEHIRNRVAR